MNTCYHGFGRHLDGKAYKTLISSIFVDKVGSLIISPVKLNITFT